LTYTRDSCNLIGCAGFRVEFKQSGSKLLNPPWPFLHAVTCVNLCWEKFEGLVLAR